MLRNSNYFTKQDNFLRNKENCAELRNIIPIYDSQLASKRLMSIEMLLYKRNIANTMIGTCEQRGRFKNKHTRSERVN